MNKSGRQDHPTNLVEDGSQPQRLASINAKNRAIWTKPGEHLPLPTQPGIYERIAALESMPGVPRELFGRPHSPERYLFATRMACAKVATSVASEPEKPKSVSDAQPGTKTRPRSKLKTDQKSETEKRRDVIVMLLKKYPGIGGRAYARKLDHEFKLPTRYSWRLKDLKTHEQAWTDQNFKHFQRDIASEKNRFRVG
jgi:hypothetical protein